MLTRDSASHLGNVTCGIALVQLCLPQAPLEYRPTEWQGKKTYAKVPLKNATPAGLKRHHGPYAWYSFQARSCQPRRQGEWHVLWRQQGKRHRISSSQSEKEGKSRDRMTLKVGIRCVTQPEPQLSMTCTNIHKTGALVLVSQI